MITSILKLRYYVLTGIYVQYESKKEQDLFYLFEVGKQKFAYGFKLSPETSKGTLRLATYPDLKNVIMYFNNPLVVFKGNRIGLMFRC